MNFNKHYSLEGKHAFLGASKYHWVNYDNDKIADSYLKHQSTLKGTILHDFAAQCIQLGQKLPKSQKTLNMYVNDAIGFKMQPEQVLYYSDNCFGTADSIIFRNNLLRIHDLKTGVTKAHMEQLEIYAALFCLEYNKKPGEIDMELRIYQNNEIVVHHPTADDILPIMDKIMTFDKIIEKLKTIRSFLIFLKIQELKWTGMGEFNSDDHYVYYCRQESLRRNGVAIMVKKRV